MYEALRGAPVYEALRRLYSEGCIQVCGLKRSSSVRGLKNEALRGALVYEALRRKAVFRYASRRIQVCIQVCVCRYVYAGMCRGVFRYVFR